MVMLSEREPHALLGQVLEPDDKSFSFYSLVASTGSSS